MLKAVFGTLSAALGGFFVMSNLSALLHSPRIPAPKEDADE
jgi:hypothetical protein